MEQLLTRQIPLDSTKESRFASFIVHNSIILVEQCVKMWVCMRRPSGNRKPSASEPNPAAEPDSRRVSYGTYSTYSWTHTCKQRVRVTKGRSNPQFSSMTSAGAFQNLVWWLTSTGLSAQRKGWCSEIHFCHHSLALMLFSKPSRLAFFRRRQKEMSGRMFEKLFFSFSVDGDL